MFSFWLFIILVTCVDLFFQYFNHVNLIGNEAILQGPIYRLGGFMGEELKISNFIFHFGTLVFIYFFSENFFKKNKIIFLYVLFLILIIASIYITAERSNFIVAMSFFLIFNLFLLFKNRKILIFVGTIFSAMIILLSISNKDLKERMIINNVLKEVKKLHYDPDKSYLNKDSVYFAHYSTAFQLFQKNMLFGVGLKNYRKFCNNSEFNKNIHPAQHGRKCATHPHNFYFEFLSEVGLIGFIVMQLLTGLATSLTMLYIARILGGIFTSAVIPVSNAYLSDITSRKHRTKIMAWSGVAISSGVIFGPVLGSFLSQTNLHFKYSLGILHLDRFSIPFLLIALLGFIVMMILDVSLG